MTPGFEVSTPLGEKTEVTKEVTLTKRFLRIAVTLGGSNTGATCLAYGYLNARQH
jgi:hypothetical protein